MIHALLMFHQEVVDSVLNDNYKALNMLIKLGVDLNKVNKTKNLLIHASREMVIYLIKNGVKITEPNFTPLHNAIESCDLELFYALIDADYPLDHDIGIFYTPLVAACHDIYSNYYRMKMFKQLIDCGADVNIIYYNQLFHIYDHIFSMNSLSGYRIVCKIKRFYDYFHKHYGIQIYKNYYSNYKKMLLIMFMCNNCEWLIYDIIMSKIVPYLFI